MHTIGLIGGVASGKSLVASELARLGAVVLDADRAGHVALTQPEVIAALRERWGDEVCTADGQIDRAAVARRVFGEGPGPAAERRFLEQVTHPRIGELMAAQAAEAAARGAAALVLDAPLLLQAGWDRLCDRIVFVDAQRHIRCERARRRGWTEAEFNAREGAQESLDIKRAHADVVIDNSGSVEDTRKQVEHFWHTRVGPTSRPSAAVSTPSLATPPSS